MDALVYSLYPQRGALRLHPVPNAFRHPAPTPLNEQFGIKGAPGDRFDDGFDQGFSHFNTTGYAPLGTQCCWPNINNMDNFQIVDNLMIQKGNHSLKMGFDWRRLNIFREAMRFRRGQFSFNSVFTAEKPLVGSSRASTGNGLADMLMGWASATRQGNPAGENPIVPYWGAYIQDDWKVMPKLTLTLGLRWELFQGSYFPAGHIKGRTG
ncbi:MAG: TonB-dependent receptor, partial [bacterium]|nr:TonB-dependent receptor [bacterium]